MTFDGKSFAVRHDIQNALVDVMTMLVNTGVSRSTLRHCHSHRRAERPDRGGCSDKGRAPEPYAGETARTR